MSDFTGLAIAGRIATPSDSDWDEARLAWNLAADQQPEAVAFVESADDVAKTVALRRRERPQGRRPGHRPRRRRARPPLEGTILIKTERMRGIEVDPEAQTARVEAGVLVARAGRGRAARTGSARCRAPRPTSASPATRSAAASAGSAASYGFACNRVAAIELVTADGEAAHGRRRERPRPLLGAARRRRRLRDRHRPAPRRCCRSPTIYAGALRLPGRARRRRGPRLPRLGRRASPTRSPRSSASSPRRRSPTCPSRCAACRC